MTEAEKLALVLEGLGGGAYQSKKLDEAAALLRSQAAEIEQLKHLNRILENEWQNRFDAQTAENQRLREALLNVARKAEMLKQECGSDPESQQAIRNGRYMHLSYVARAALGEVK